MRYAAIFILALTLHGEIQAAKRDFKGLFGSYRREKFIENEARSSDFGVDIMLSTLLPISTIVSSQESSTGSFQPLYYSAFFNGEFSFHFSLNYHFETFLSVGYYSYETRKENATPELESKTKRAIFHVFELTAAPVILGLRYRLSTDDLVPYLGAGIGMTNVRQKAYYDYNTTSSDERNFNAITGELILGFEFYFAARAGIRLELAGYLLNFPGDTYSPGGTPEINPNFQYSASPILVRYASGLFWLF